jgi:hypothetical protein
MSQCNIEIDRRFTLTLEYAGYTHMMQVLRFCGQWLGSFHTAKEAREARRQAIVKHLEELN